MTLLEFIMARLDEDEERARAAGGDAWELVDRGWMVKVTNTTDGSTIAMWDQANLPRTVGWLSDHPYPRYVVAEHPQATLRRCAIFRAMLGHAAEAAHYDQQHYYDRTAQPRDLTADPVLDTLMHRTIAAYWCKHPDYQAAEWTPEEGTHG